jgi:chromosome segregation ATPase
MEPNTGEEAKVEALLAASELEFRKREASERLGRLEQERHMLEEIRDSLAVEEKLLKRRIAAAEGDFERVVENTNEMIERIAKMEEQIEDYKRQIVIIERRYLENQSRERTLKDDIAATERLLRGERNAISSVTEELERGRSALMRMDQKLSLSLARR